MVLAADGDRDTAGLVSWGSEPLAITSWTLSLAFCKMLIACWCVIVWSSACPLIARIWSVSCNLPSLSRMKKKVKDIWQLSRKSQVFWHILSGDMFNVHALQALSGPSTCHNKCFGSSCSTPKQPSHLEVLYFSATHSARTLCLGCSHVLQIKAKCLYLQVVSGILIKFRSSCMGYMYRSLHRNFTI